MSYCFAHSGWPFKLAGNEMKKSNHSKTVVESLRNMTMNLRNGPSTLGVRQ